MFTNIKIGDKVVRYLGGKDGILIPLTVTQVTNTTIKCGVWEFDKSTGEEVDKDLHWTAAKTGSYIVQIVDEPKSLNECQYYITTFVGHKDITRSNMVICGIHAIMMEELGNGLVRILVCCTEEKMESLKSKDDTIIIEARDMSRWAIK